MCLQIRDEVLICYDSLDAFSVILLITTECFCTVSHTFMFHQACSVNYHSYDDKLLTLT